VKGKIGGLKSEGVNRGGEKKKRIMPKRNLMMIKKTPKKKKTLMGLRGRDRPTRRGKRVEKAKKKEHLSKGKGGRKNTINTAGSPTTA